MQKFVINSTDSNTYYSFFMPLVSILWKAIGFKTVNVITRYSWNTPHSAYILDKIREHSDILELIDPVEGFRISTSVQTVRVIVPCLGFLEQDDYLLTSDVDMLPLNGQYFNDFNADLFNIYSSDAYGEWAKVDKYPICYLGGRASMWQEIMRYSSNDLQSELNRSLDDRLDSWDNDEMYFGGRLKTCKNIYPSKCNFKLREWPFSRAKDRLDRDHWYVNQDRYIDCHSKRPGHEHKKLIVEVINKNHGSEVASKINKYFEEYEKIV